ncbi:transposase [Candidatus Regiella insecticola]|uniref:Transposase n=1 Tax=Candidatus Regiella insecticola TaxID=138073 RepID=A0A6L2ZQ87_9ENTR|nr:transposase [Candidatus Regiella insecticola]
MLNIKQQSIFELQAAGLVVSAHVGLRKTCHAQAVAFEVGSLAQ